MIGVNVRFCGELHYPRIPYEYWRARLEMARAIGIDAVSTYVFWNVHEETEGVFRFDGRRDVAAFVRMADAAGLRVVLRPGPYVCAEWEFGGLPAWLLRDGVRIRSTDPRYLAAVRRWFGRLGEELAPLTAARGGPIVAVQLENEYGAFGEDKQYLEALRAQLQACGLGGVPLYTIDQPHDLARGALDGVAAAVTFAPGDAGSQFAELRALRPDQPLACGEFWTGWFDHWGEPRSHIPAETEAADLDWMLANGVAVNLYMLHGGSNAALFNGANTAKDGTLQPTVTSYDYQAPIDEAGRPTEKFFRLRSIAEKYLGPAPRVPDAPAVSDLPAFHCDDAFTLDGALGDPVAAKDPLTMEQLGGSRGFVLYKTVLQHDTRGALQCDLRDSVIVMVNGEPCTAQIDAKAGDTLELLVENLGRVNYGSALHDQRKGIVGTVSAGGRELSGWEMRLLDCESPRLVSGSQPALRPRFLRGFFQVDEPADTFLDTGSFEKGVLWINGSCAGRFWNKGPQRDLYIPAPWLRRGNNEAVVFDLIPKPGTHWLLGKRERVWSAGTP